MPEHIETFSPEERQRLVQLERELAAAHNRILEVAVSPALDHEPLRRHLYLTECDVLKRAAHILLTWADEGNDHDV